VGNSRIKWGFAEHGKLIAHGEDNHPSRLSAFAAKHWSECEKPSAVIISNVSKQSLGERIHQWVVRQWEIEPILVIPQAECKGVVNAYAEPSQLGSDRWAMLIAARHLTRSPAFIVSCGTAITVDALDSKGQHLGGLILPGLEMMRNALVAKTERIKLNEQEAKTPVFLASDTKGAVMGGTLYTAVAAIDRISRDVLSELGASTQCFITGGDAFQLLKLLSGKYEHHPHLVLEGLVYLANGEANT
jgi:type III pantothenate kinase